MRQSIFTFIAFLVSLPALFSCGENYDNNLKKMSAIFKKNLEDTSFKYNQTLKIYESKIIGYDTIDDSYFMKEIRSDIMDFISREESHKSEFLEVASSFGKKMDKKEVSTIKKYGSEIKGLKAIVDSMDGGKYKKSGERFYLYKEYLKATAIYPDGKKENYMDTLRVAFSKDFKEINNLENLPPEIILPYKRALSIYLSK